MTNAESQTTSYTYDDANRRTQTTWPDHVAMTSAGDADYGITEVAYDAMGQLLRATDQLGDTITRVYDLAGRMTDREYWLRVNSPSGTIADEDEFTYDAASRNYSRLTKAATIIPSPSPNDDASRLATEALTVDSQTYTIGRDYNDAGRLSEITYPDGTIVDRTYTARGQLDDVDYASSTVASFTYDDGARETTRTFGNTVATTTSYISGENLINTLTNSTIGNYAYSYDANDAYVANDNKTAETISGYDDENRLVNWERDDTNLDLSWNLSDVGDWDSFTENAVTQNRTHDDTHELTAIDMTALSYDAKGNLTEDEAGIHYDWDFDNMLAEVTVPMGASRGTKGTHVYAYDALGRRVSKSVQDGMTTTTTVFVCLTQPITYSSFAGQAPSRRALLKTLRPESLDDPADGIRNAGQE